MKLRNVFIPAAVGAGAMIAANALAPQYITATAIGSGALILYGLTRQDSKEPHAIGVEYDKDSKGVLVTIKNPSKKSFAVTSEVRLKPIIEPTDSTMLRASIDRGSTTLIGEMTEPYIIGPSETVTLRHELLIPRNMVESSGGNIEIKLDFHNFKSYSKLHGFDNKNALLDIETETIKKVNDELDKYKFGISSIPKFEDNIKPIDSDTKTNQDIIPETPIEETIITIQPQQYIQIIDIPEDPSITTKITSIIDPLELSSYMEININQTIPDTQISTENNTRQTYKKGCGKNIGYSNSMLNIINGLERIKRPKSTIYDDAI